METEEDREVQEESADEHAQTEEDQNADVDHEDVRRAQTGWEPRQLDART